MQKDDFKKEVTAFFSASKLHELSAFLHENKRETIEHKQFIKKLNKQLGQPFITSTITEVENLQKEEEKRINAAIIDAVKNNDEVALFDALKPLNANEQLRMHHHVMKNSSLYNKYIKSIIDKKDELTDGYERTLKNICFRSGIEKLNSLGTYYQNSSNNIDDKIDFLINKSGLYVNSNNFSNTEKIETVNQLFDMLQTYKSKDQELNLSAYFSTNLDEYVYLHESNRQKINDKYNVLNQTSIIARLLDRNNSALNYYVESYDKDYKLEVSFELYFTLVNRINTDKFVIGKDEKFTDKKLSEKLISYPRYILKIVDSQTLQDFLKKQEHEYTIPEESQYNATKENNNFINHIIYELNKNEVDNLFNKLKIFNLSEQQRFIVDDYLTNHEKNIFKTINHEKDMPRNIGPRAIKEYISLHANETDFIERLNPKGKKHIINSHMDCLKIENSAKFINDFLVDLPKEQYSCFHGSMLHRLGDNKHKEQIMKYLLNEKTEFNPHSVYHSIELFHLFSDEKKKEMVGGVLSEKKERNHFETYYKHMEKDTRLNSQEKSNLKELKEIYDCLFAEKENAIQQQKKYKAKKK